MLVQTVTVKAWFPLCRYRLSRYRLGSHCVGTSCHGKGLTPIASNYGHDFIVELIDKCIMQMKLHEEEVDIRLK